MPAALIAEALSEEGEHDHGRLARAAQALTNDEVSAQEALRQLFLLGEVIARDRTGVGVVALVHALGQGAETIAAAYLSTAERVAGTDELTSLPNRRTLENDFRGALERVRIRGGSVALGVIDLDGLKVANDEFGGHAAGDHYIMRFGVQLRDAVREHRGRVYRWHGDEFCVLFRDLDRSEAEAVLRAFRRRDDVAPFCYGVSACPEDGDDPDLLYVLADEDRLMAMKNQRLPEERRAEARAWLESEHWDFEAMTGG